MAEPRPVTVFRGDTLVHARGPVIDVLRSDGAAVTAVTRFEVDRPVARMVVAADGSAVIGFDLMHERAWLWRPERGVRELAVSTGPRDTFAFALLPRHGRTLVLRQRSGELTAETLDGEPVFAVDTRSPHAFSGHSFVELGRDRLGIVGRVFGDSSDTAVTVGLAALERDPEALQAALDTGLPLLDRAPRLAMGCCGDDAVVFRDPEDDEPPDDDPDDQPDVWGFRGFYVRDLATGDLRGRIAYRGAVASGAPMVATADRIAVQALTGVDLIDRTSGLLDHVGGAAVALDPRGARVAALGFDGGWTVRSVDG